MERVKINFCHDSNVVKLSADSWRELGLQMASPSSYALSTKNHPLSPSLDVDFNPIPYLDGYIGWPIVIEIETVGFPERRAKVDEDMVRRLKEDFLRILQENDVNFDPKKPTVRIEIKYEDLGNIYV